MMQIICYLVISIILYLDHTRLSGKVLLSRVIALTL